jgi:DNA polymerase-3 subunit delta
VKLTQKDFAAKAPGAARTAGIFFFCGQDEAGASAAAQALIGMLPEAGERVEMAGAQLRADPALLGDEARSNSLFGDTRHIYARVTGDEAHDALKLLTETGDMGAGEACPVVVVATSATDKSRTAKLLEKRKDAVVAMFYPPDLQSVTRSVRGLADGAGVRLSGDLAERIARAANLDVRLAKSEVEKLALYLDATAQSPQSATAEDLDAIGAASEDDGFTPLVNAVMGGQAAKVGTELARMKQLGLNPVGVLLAFERRAAQLARIAAALGPRSFGDLDRGEEARLGIFFKEKRDIGQQLALWRHGDKLGRLTQRLVTLHRELLTNSQAAELLLAQGLADIARVAGARAR